MPETRYPDTWNSRAGERSCQPGDPCDACLAREAAGDPDQHLKKAKAAVLATEGHLHLTADDLYIVWFAKTLGNWKALISTDALAGAYWEVTYNGAKQETYVDAYAKVKNEAISDEMLGQ